MSGNPSIRDRELAAQQAEEQMKEFDAQVEAFNSLVVRTLAPDEFDGLKFLDQMVNGLKLMNEMGEMNCWWEPDTYVCNSAGGYVGRLDLEAMRDDIAKSIGRKIVEFHSRVNREEEKEPDANATGNDAS